MGLLSVTVLSVPKITGSNIWKRGWATCGLARFIGQKGAQMGIPYSITITEKAWRKLHRFSSWQKIPITEVASRALEAGVDKLIVEAEAQVDLPAKASPAKGESDGPNSSIKVAS